MPSHRTRDRGDLRSKRRQWRKVMPEFSKLTASADHRRIRCRTEFSRSAVCWLFVEKFSSKQC